MTNTWRNDVVFHFSLSTAILISLVRLTVTLTKTVVPKKFERINFYRPSYDLWDWFLTEWYPRRVNRTEVSGRGKKYNRQRFAAARNFHANVSWSISSTDADRGTFLRSGFRTHTVAVSRHFSRCVFFRRVFTPEQNNGSISPGAVRRTRCKFSNQQFKAVYSFN